MKLKRFNKINENSEMYFVSKTKSIEEQKFEIIEKLSQNWSEKLKQDYLIPRSLYHYSLDELKNIEKHYLNESSDELDYDLIGTLMKNAGWGDIMNTQRVEEFETSEYYNKDANSEEYANDFDTFMKSISDGTINENIKIVEPKNNDLENTLKELKEQHLSNEAVEDIRLEGNEIIFDINCETEIQGTTEYNGVKLKYNKLCSVPQVNDSEINEEINEEIDEEIYEEIDEGQIFEQINSWKIKL